MRNSAAMWIATADLYLCLLGITIAAVNPPAKKADSIDMKAEYVITISWPVTVDADADNWLKTPRGTVFYLKDHRQVGCVTLDMDNHGKSDSRFEMLDGSTQTISESREIITLRCKEPGRYDHAVHLYGYSDAGVSQITRHDLGLKVHIELTELNPTVKPLYTKDITLDYIEQTINDFSFEIAHDGSLKLVDPPFEDITNSYYHPSGHQ